ncbi:type IV secretion system DNA-binding domain-containing protein [Haloferax volcanii]|uniref:Type IV secretion system DNA-binding domain-containing protein n=1 Tax=Haloferax volcanii TaxID=2246 RepID=A0A6C0UV75_HALVO|nr:type IV secretion system DNA-binding domain-containing protein [Haloferax alexandrinus]QIB79077.1 type IV secretion system DNA-binding domain-containing protein [Haloferax alexandrinus]
MGLLDSLRGTEQREEAGYDAVEIDADLATSLTSPGERDAISVRPNKDNGGIEAMTNVLESLHSVETDSPRLSRSVQNVSPAHSFEMRYTREQGGGDRVVTMQYVAGDDRTDGTLKRQLQTQYPDSQLDRVSSEVIPECGVDGRYIAGATLQLRRYTLYPIKNLDLPGFSTDPTGAILEEMVGTQDESETDADVVVQVMFKPARRTWTEGVDGGHGLVDDDDEAVNGTPGIKTLAMNLRQPTYKKERRLFTRETVEYPPSKVDKSVASLLEEQQGEKGWRLCLRVFAISDDPSVAISRASTTAGMFRNFYESNSEQTFVPDPLDEGEVRETALRAADREWVNHGIVKAQREVAGLLNIPESQYVTTNKMRWSMSRPGEGVPPGTPRFDFAEHNVAGASHEEKQVAMLDESGRGDPFWYGFGSRHGVEVGIEPDVLNVHQFVGGGTGKGKTTYLTNLSSQIMERGHGAMIFDPKGKDADEFIREWPEDRDREDFVFVDLTDEYENKVRFNFLEVPGDVEPGTRKFASTVEALCDDLTAMISQAGGDDNYWGALMDRVARTLIRGMAKSGRTCTLLDLACVCTNPDNRDKFAEWMSEERMHFIEDAAERIREKEDSDLEPLAGRLDQWVQNDAIRDLIAARESTVSISEVVRDGKVVVVRNAPSSGETEKRLFATALIRRAWVAARENRDSPPFYVVLDEFDSIVSEQSDIHSILSEARAFDFCLTLSCQNPSNQLPEQVQKAVENQCETFISFNPGGKDDARLIAAQHSPEVSWEDLTNLSKYKFFMRTHDDTDTLTHSYKVDAFPPVGEVRREVNGVAGMTDEELDTLKRESVERYGEPMESAEQQKRQSHFYDLGGVGPDGHDGGNLELTDERATKLLAALFRLRVSQDLDDSEPIQMVDAKEAVRERVDVDGQHVDTLIQRANSRDLVDVSNDATTIDLAPAGREQLFSSGQSGNAGSIAHQAAMEPIAHDLAEMGYHVRVPEQTGDEMPDLFAECPVDTGGETFEEAMANRDRLKEQYPDVFTLSEERDVAVEFEKATRSAPAQIGHNLRKAVESGDHCLFIVNQSDDDGERFADAARQLSEKLADPMLTYTERRTPNDVEARYHHRDDKCPAVHQEDAEDPSKFVAIPGDVTYQWVLDGDLVVLRDSGGTEYARFADVDEWTSRSATDWPARYRVGDDGHVTVSGDSLDEYESVDALREDYTLVSAPYIPEIEFVGAVDEPGALPTRDEWTIAVLPNDNIGLQRYDRVDDTCYPLAEGIEDRESGSRGENPHTEGREDAGPDAVRPNDGDDTDDLWSDSLL